MPVSPAVGDWFDGAQSDDADSVGDRSAQLGKVFGPRTVASTPRGSFIPIASHNKPSEVFCRAVLVRLSIEIYEKI